MKLDALRQKKADALAKARAAYAPAQAENRLPSADEKAAYDAAMAEAAGCDPFIKDLEALADQERNAPAIPAASTGAPGASVGKNHAEDKPWANAGEILLAVRTAAVTHSRIVDQRLLASQGANETVDAEGGFLLQPEVSATLLQRSYDEGQLTQRCDRTPMGSSRLELPALDETSRKNGMRYGGINVYRVGEGQTYTPSKSKLMKTTLVANKLIALTYLTDELQEDANASALNAWLFNNFPKALAFEEDAEVFSGTGAGQFLGIMNSGALITVAKDSGQAAATISTTNVLGMYGRLWAPSRKNAAWFINQDMEAQLLNLTRGSGVAVEFLYKMPGERGNNNAYGTMLGLPVIPVEQASTTGTLGDVVLADLSEYIIGERGGLKADSSIHVAFLTGEQAFRWTVRNDGQPKWKTALTPYNGANTLSPFVALATRS